MRPPAQAPAARATSLFLLIIRQKSGNHQAHILSDDADLPQSLLIDARSRARNKKKGNIPMTARLNARLNEHFLPRTLAAVLMAAFALPTLGASTAHAENGEVRLSWLSVVEYRNLDPADSRHRRILLERVEAEAHKLCNGELAGGDMVKSDRRACEKALVAKSMTSASEPVRKALALAQAERNGVAQAMR
jgi:UrcA family protein